MRRRWAGRLAALALALPVPATADAIAIRHAPVECVPRDRYSRIAASGAPAESVAAAELQFRVAGDGPWYSVRMTAQDGEWSAVLPRPIQPLARFEYRIVMRSAALQEAATAPMAVGVGDDPAGCGGAAQSSVAVGAPIVVRVPAGAPVVPPVPPGFSPAGVVAQEPPPKSGATKWVAGASLAGGIVAAVVAAGSSQRTPEADVLPEFQFFGTAPAPGSVLSLSRDRLTVSVRISGGPRVFLTFGWRFELRAGAGETACAVMTGVASINSARPTVVTLTERLAPSGGCGQRFEVDTARLVIVVLGRGAGEEQVAYDQTLVLPYRVEP